MRNKTYLYTALCSTCLCIHFQILPTFIGQLTPAYGIDDLDFDNKMGTYMPAFGIVGSVLYSIVLTWYPKKMMLGQYSINFGLILTWAFFYYVDTLGSKMWLCVASAAVGFFLCPVVFVSFELAVE